jgi:ACT domain-containing protein
MKAVITVTGRDVVGIIAKVSAACAENHANIIDISQSVLSEYFAMIMVVEIDQIAVEFTQFVEKMEQLGRDNGLVIHTMHEDVFNVMHHI